MRWISYIAVFGCLFAAILPSSAGSADPVFGYGDRSLYSSYRHYNLVRSSERSGWAAVSELGGGIETGLLPGAELRWEYSDRRLEFFEHDLENSDFSLTGHTRSGWIGMRLPLVDDRATLEVQSGVTSPETGPVKPRFAASLHIRPLAMVAVNAYVGSRTDALSLDGIFWGERISLDLPLRRSSSGLDGQLQVLEALSIRLGYHDLGLADSQPEASREFSSSISGAVEHRYQGVRIGDPDGVHLDATAHQIDAGGQLNLFSRGIRFGQASKIKGRIDWYRLEGAPPFATRNLTLAAEYLTCSVEAAGHVEGWPFMDPLENLLGARRNFKGGAEVEFWRLSGKTVFRPAPAWDVTTVIDLCRLYPELHFADWMPSFLVFGVQDMDRYNDEYDRIDFGRLQLEVSRKIGRVVIGGRISQLFPIEVRKPQGSTSSDSEQSDPADTSGRSARDDGGRSIQLWLTYSLQ